MGRSHWEHATQDLLPSARGLGVADNHRKRSKQQAVAYHNGGSWQVSHATVYPSMHQDEPSQTSPEGSIFGREVTPNQPLLRCPDRKFHRKASSTLSDMDNHTSKMMFENPGMASLCSLTRQRRR